MNFLLDMSLDTTLYSKWDQVSDLSQQLKLASEFESDLQDTGLGWGREWLIDFNEGDMDVSVFEEKSSFEMLGLGFSPKLDWGSYTISIAKTASKKIGAFSMNFKEVSFSWGCCISI